MSPTRRPAGTVSELARYLRTETIGGIFLLVAAGLALIWANIPGAGYESVRDIELGPDLWHLRLSIGDWVKDGLLALFFYVVGLELKRELLVGELADRRGATLPVAAAIGGMVVPAAITLLVGWGEPGIERAWAVPVATDIAFALGVLAITGSGMPASARVFLLSLAVVDDLGAIALIAVLFTGGLDVLWLAVAVACCLAYWYLQKRRVRASSLYVPLAAMTWIAVHSSGIHATIAGVALGLLTRVRRDPHEPEAPALRLEHRLQPWSAGVAVPVFALFAAGIPISGESLSALTTDRLALAIVLGLVLGKVIGIVGACLIAVGLGIAVKPPDLAWRDIVAIATLGGIGFTVSLLIAELALGEEQTAAAKAAVLIASVLASVLAAMLLRRRGRHHRSGGQRPDDSNMAG